MPSSSASRDAPSRRGTNELDSLGGLTRALQDSGRDDYSDKSLPSRYHLEDSAWILRSGPKRKQVGFVRSRTLKFEERYILDDE